MKFKNILIKKFIFVYHFSEKENVEKIEEKLGLSSYNLQELKYQKNHLKK